MYNVQYSVLFFLLLLFLFLLKNERCSAVICEDGYLTHMWKTLAGPHLFSLKGEVWVHKYRLPPPLFIEVPMLSQESERLCICVLRVLSLPICTICPSDFGNVPTVWYLLLISGNKKMNSSR